MKKSTSGCVQGERSFLPQEIQEEGEEEEKQRGSVGASYEKSLNGKVREDSRKAELLVGVDSLSRKRQSNVMLPEVTFNKGLRS